MGSNSGVRLSLLSLFFWHGFHGLRGLVKGFFLAPRLNKGKSRFNGAGGFHGLRGFGFLLLREKFSVSRKGAKALRKEGNHK